MMTITNDWKERNSTDSKIEKNTADLYLLNLHDDTNTLPVVRNLRRADHVQVHFLRHCK